MSNDFQHFDDEDYEDYLDLNAWVPEPAPYTPISIKHLARQALIHIEEGISESVVKHYLEMKLPMPKGTVDAYYEVEQESLEMVDPSGERYRIPTSRTHRGTIHTIWGSETYRLLDRHWHQRTPLSLEKFKIPGRYYVTESFINYDAQYIKTVIFKLIRIH